MHFGLAAAGPQLRVGLGVREGELGLLLACIPAGLMIGTFAWGELADRLGERRVLVLAYSLVVAAFAAASGVAWAAWESVPPPTSGMLVALGALLLVAGTCGSAAHSAGGRAIVEAFPPHRHARVLAIRHTLIPVGGTIGGLVVPAAVHVAGLGWALVIAAALGVAVVLGMHAALPAVGGARLEPATQRRAAATDAASDGELAASREGEARSASPLRSPTLWLLGGSCSMFALVQLGLVSFLTTYLVDESGMRVSVAAGVFSAAQLTGAAARIGLGDLADRRNDPFAVLTAVAVVALALVVIALAVPTSAAGWLLTAALLVLTSWNGVAVAAAARLAPANRTGATLGMQTTMFATMGVAAPVAAGAVLQRSGWQPLLVAATAAMVVACVGLAAVRRSGPPCEPRPV